jgi:site-specific recombinase XerD
MNPIERFEREYIQYHRISAQRGRQQVKLLTELESRVDGTILDVQPSDLQSWAGEWLDSGLHVNTVRKRLNMIRPFYGWAYAAKLITADDWLSLKAVKDPRGATGRTLPNPYSRAELAEFWAALDAKLPMLPKTGRRSQALTRWLRGKGPWANVWRHGMRLQIEAMVRLALDLGLRRAEIFGLSVDDLHYDNEYIVVKGKADPNTGKPKIRQIAFTQAARDAVKEWVEFRALLRPSHSAAWLCLYSRWAANPMRRSRFETLLPETVGEGWRWHRFRHTCATEWLRAGMELENVSTLLGHASLQQTLAYAQILKSDIARQMAKHEGVFAEAVTNRAA